MWKKIDRNPNYSINENGEVRNDKTKHIKNSFTNKRNGYLMVDLYQNNKSEKVQVYLVVIPFRVKVERTRSQEDLSAMQIFL